MHVASLLAWTVTILAGLVLLVIWLMEYDRDFQTAVATRLPIPLISTHALLGLGGLMVWGFYLVTDGHRLVWVTLPTWPLSSRSAWSWRRAGSAFIAPTTTRTHRQRQVITVPPERHFPRPVIVIHGISAVATVGLVLYTVVFSGS